MYMVSHGHGELGGGRDGGGRWYACGSKPRRLVACGTKPRGSSHVGDAGTCPVCEV